MDMAFWERFMRIDSEWARMVVAPVANVDALVAELRADLPHQSAGVRIVRGHRCPHQSGVFAELAAALQFPGYFGENWDALDECLGDLDWLQAGWYVLVVTEVPEILRGREREFGVLMEILKSAALTWAEPVPA